MGCFFFFCTACQSVFNEPVLVVFMLQANGKVGASIRRVTTSKRPVNFSKSARNDSVSFANVLLPPYMKLATGSMSNFTTFQTEFNNPISHARSRDSSRSSPRDR